MLSLVNAVATLVRFRARASVALLCVWATLLFANLASAEVGVQAKTRIWDFESAAPLNVCPFFPASAEQHREIRSCRSELATESLLAARGAGEASTVLLRTPRNLQKLFGKHGADFGLRGNWNPSRAADASRAIHQHINSPGVRTIEGAYRGNPATHYVDPSTGLNVVADPAGNFVTGYRLGPDQLSDLLTTGHLF